MCEILNHPRNIFTVSNFKNYIKIIFKDYFDLKIFYILTITKRIPTMKHLLNVITEYNSNHL